MRKGDVIDGTWVVDRALGRGGMGSVYLCHHRQSSRILAAIKVLAGSLRDDGDALARFVREAEILHRLDHTSVVKVRNVRVHGDPPYLEMEYVEGPHLGELIGTEGLPVKQAVDYARQILAALAYLHGNDVRHRDIKPDNLLVRQGTEQVVLVDFGLALDAGVTRLTVGNMAFGTVAYSPPEWLKPSEIDPCAWDLYATGVILWEMLTGEEPFPASGEGPPRQQALQVMLGKQGAPPLDPGPEFPPRLRRLVRAMTDPDPAPRPKTATEILGMLELAIAELDADEWDTADHEDSAILSGLADTEDASLQPTQVPPPYRVSASHQLVEPRGTRRPLALLIPAVLFIAALAAWGAQRLVAGSSPEGLMDLPSDEDSVAVQLLLPEVPDPRRLAVALDGRLPNRTTDRAAWFDEIPPGPQSIQWVYGEGCALHACPGDECEEHCGSGTVVVEIPSEGPTPAVVDLTVQMPEREVRVLVRALTEPRRGLFKKDPPIPWGYLAGVKGEADGDNLVFTGVPPGQHVLLVAMGDCPTEAKGCSREGTCPAGCSSMRRDLTVSWQEGPLEVGSSVPLPQ